MKNNNILAFIFLGAFSVASCNSNSTTVEEQKVLATGNSFINQNNSSIQVEEKWTLPAILDEVSGIAYLDQNRFACVQDESGTIFIYNTSTSKIEKEISFAGNGDYEGIALADETAYVLRSDGTIFEVKNWQGNNPVTTEFSTPLTEDHNLEGICYDKANKRLLLAIKGNEPGKKDYKGIYAFNLSSKKLLNEPVYKIDLTHKVFESTGEDNLNKRMRPSEIGINPQTADIYITDAKDPKILIMNRKGEITTIHPLDKSDFAQAEGIAFSPAAELFIANEGKNGKANILKVKLR